MSDDKTPARLRKSSSRPPEPTERLRKELDEVTLQGEFRHFAEYSAELIESIVVHDSADLIASADQMGGGAKPN